MSSNLFSPDNEPDETDSIILEDDQGLTLECYIENALEDEEFQYLLLMPVDIPITIIAWDEEEEETEVKSATLLEDHALIKKIFPDAKAVLAELDLSLHLTAYTLTVSGELPPIDDDEILTLEIEEDNPEIEPEELQYLANFFHEKQRYSIYTPLAPMLLLAEADADDQVDLVHPDNEKMKFILETLLFDEME